MRKGPKIALIVVGSIAILAAILIPTFSSTVDKANESAAFQKATNALQIVTMEEDGELSGTYYFTVGYGDDAYCFKYTAGTYGGALAKIDAKDIPSGATAVTNTDIANLGVTVVRK